MVSGASKSGRVLARETGRLPLQERRAATEGVRIPFPASFFACKKRIVNFDKYGNIGLMPSPAASVFDLTNNHAGHILVKEREVRNVQEKGSLGY